MTIVDDASFISCFVVYLVSVPMIFEIASIIPQEISEEWTVAEALAKCWSSFTIGIFGVVLAFLILVVGYLMEGWLEI